MRHSKLRQAVATTAAALALLALTAPAADARKRVVEPSQTPPADLIIMPVKPFEPIEECICLPPVD